MDKKRATTYENEVLNVLAYEFPFSDQAESEAKIKRRLKRKKLGLYDAERIALLRRLKDELQEEIGKHRQSDYFTHRLGKYCDMRDFDVLRLTRDMIERHPQIPEAEVESFVPFCVFIYHML